MSKLDNFPGCLDLLISKCKQVLDPSSLAYKSIIKYEKIWEKSRGAEENVQIHKDLFQDFYNSHKKSIDELNFSFLSKEGCTIIFGKGDQILEKKNRKIFLSIVYNTAKIFNVNTPENDPRHFYQRSIEMLLAACISKSFPPSTVDNPVMSALNAFVKKTSVEVGLLKPEPPSTSGMLGNVAGLMKGLDFKGLQESKVMQDMKNVKDPMEVFQYLFKNPQYLKDIANFLPPELRGQVKQIASDEQGLRTMREGFSKVITPETIGNINKAVTTAIQKSDGKDIDSLMKSVSTVVSDTSLFSTEEKATPLTPEQTSHLLNTTIADMEKKLTLSGQSLNSK